MAKNKQGLWKLGAEGAPDMLLWSDGYMHLSDKAVRKYRRLLAKASVELDKNAPVESRLVTCPVDGCYEFATELLTEEAHLACVPKNWRFVGEVEFDRMMTLVTVCPMCEKHARRFRKSLAQRILQLEARLDELHDDVHRLEDY